MMSRYGQYPAQGLNKINKCGDSADNIYFNIEMSNTFLLPCNPVNNITQFVMENKRIPAAYYENLSQKIVENPSQYYLTIARFLIPGTAIPIFIMPIINNQANPNLTPYQICLTYLGVDYPQNIIYYTEINDAIPVPTTAIPIQQNLPYYYVYSYKHMIRMINIAYATAYAAVVAANPGPPLGFPPEPPVFIYDPVTQLISLVVPVEYLQAPENPNPTIGIFANGNLLLNYLGGIEALSFGDQSVNGKDFQFVIQYQYNNGYQAFEQDPTLLANISNQYYTPGQPNVAVPTGVIYPPTPGFSPHWLIFTQEYSTIQYWNSFRNIVFLSGTLPVQAEYIPQNQISLLGGNLQSSPQGAVAYRPILTDFEPLLSAAGNSRSELQYFPQGPYRLLDLIGTSPLTKVDLSVYWEDKNDNLYPLYIFTGQSVSVKLLFIKK
jgi:hypothetical protein